MPQSLVFMTLAMLAGASVVIQQVVTSSLRTALGSAALSGFSSYLGGLLCMILLTLALRDPFPSAAVAARIPWWAWSGGLFGAAYIVLAMVLIPKLGAATFVGLLITGQVVSSILFDHFGWLGLTQRPVDVPRLVGAGLLIAGVALTRR